MEKFFKHNKILLAIATCIAIIAIGVCIYLYIQYRHSQKLLQNPTIASQMQTQDLITKVGKLIDLPQDETPTIATVSDFTKLKDQPFFAKAKNGFKVLIYTKAKKAILYDPFSNKIVEVAPVNIGATAGSGQVISPTPQTLRVALYNGTKTIGLTNTIEQELTAKIANLSVVSKDNALNNNYKKTLVIDLTGNDQTLVSQVAQVLGAQTGPLPADEVKPQNADVLVIVGK